MKVFGHFMTFLYKMLKRLTNILLHRTGILKTGDLTIRSITLYIML